MLLKGALHVHTTCSDGELSISEAVAIHEAHLFDFIALTDHDFLMSPGCYDGLSSLSTDMIVFPGAELTFLEKSYVHVNRIQGEQEVLHMFNHPGDLNMSLENVVDCIASVACKVPLDAVEITSKGRRTPEYETDEIPYPKVATDDSHTRHMIGRAWIEMEGRKEMDSILRAIKAGDFWNCYAMGGFQ